MKTKHTKYDVAIIGGGISGIMAAHRLSEKDSSLKIVLIEKGSALTQAQLPNDY